MGLRRQTVRGWAGLLLAAFATASLVLAFPSSVQADAWDDALAEIDEALATNPNGVSEQSLRSCRAMRKTAVLLHKMGQNARAVRRLKTCRQLLGLDEYQSGSAIDPGLAWLV